MKNKFENGKIVFSKTNSLFVIEIFECVAGHFVCLGSPFQHCDFAAGKFGIPVKGAWPLPLFGIKVRKSGVDPREKLSSKVILGLKSFT